LVLKQHPHAGRIFLDCSRIAWQAVEERNLERFPKVRPNPVFRPKCPESGLLLGRQLARAAMGVFAGDGIMLLFVYRLGGKRPRV
jgi:hypothetical protein